MVSAIATCDIRNATVIQGTGMKGNSPFEYTATLTATGWIIAISSTRGYIGEITGLTLNLALEVATAARHFTF
jgi:hypothetical protein